MKIYISSSPVIARAFTYRSLVIGECEDGLIRGNREAEYITVSLSRGDKVSCDLCHRNNMVATAE